LQSSDFLDNLLKSASQDFIPEIEIECNYHPEFDSFDDVRAFYDDEVPGLTFPRPKVIQGTQAIRNTTILVLVIYIHTKYGKKSHGPFALLLF